MNRLDIPRLGFALLVTVIGIWVSLILYPNWLSQGFVGFLLLLIYAILIFTDVPKRVDALGMFLRKPGKNVIGAQLAHKLYSLIEDFENQFKNIFYEGQVINEEKREQTSPLLIRHNETRNTLNEMWRVGKELKPFVKWRNKIDEHLAGVDRQLQGYKIHIDALSNLVEQKRLSETPFNPSRELEQGIANQAYEVFGDGRSRRLNKVSEELAPLKNLLERYINANN